MLWPQPIKLSAEARRISVGGDQNPRHGRPLDFAQSSNTAKQWAGGHMLPTKLRQH